jgi:hypothetical protein
MAADDHREGIAEPPAEAPQARIGNRRLLVKSALVGTTIPVVVTLSRSAWAITCSTKGGTATATTACKN